MEWGLGIGDWGLGPIPNPQIPNPQSPTIRLEKQTIIYNIYHLFIILYKKQIVLASPKQKSKINNSFITLNLINF